jgi:hypothetical protein
LRPICPPRLTGFPRTHFNYLILRIIRSGDPVPSEIAEKLSFPINLSAPFRRRNGEDVQRRRISPIKAAIVPFRSPSVSRIMIPDASNTYRAFVERSAVDPLERIDSRRAARLASVASASLWSRMNFCRFFDSTSAHRPKQRKPALLFAVARSHARLMFQLTALREFQRETVYTSTRTTVRLYKRARTL